MIGVARPTVLATLVLTWLCGCNEAREPPKHLAVTALDSSDSAQLAIMQWHSALVANDFAKYSSIEVQGKDDTVELRRLWFDLIRQKAPEKLFAREATDDFDDLPKEDNSFKGFRTFALVGCKNGTANAPVRVMSVVSVRQVSGQWKVYGGSFGTPSTPFAGKCPIQAGI